LQVDDVEQVGGVAGLGVVHAATEDQERLLVAKGGELGVVFPVAEEFVFEAARAAIGGGVGGVADEAGVGVALAAGEGDFGAEGEGVSYP